MKVRKKSQPSNVYDGHTGQLVDSDIPAPAPSDIPEIVEAYTELIGKVIGKLAEKEKQKGPDGKSQGLESRDINSLVALGRTIAMFQATEEMRISRVGGKAIKEMTSKEMQKLLAAGGQSAPEPEEGELE